MMILVGAELIENFQPVLLVFAGILIYSAFKLLAAGVEEEDEDLTDNFIVKTCRWGRWQWLPNMCSYCWVKPGDASPGPPLFSIQAQPQQRVPPCMSLPALLAFLAAPGALHSRCIHLGLMQQLCENDLWDSYLWLQR